MVDVTFINPNTQQRLRVTELDEYMTLREAIQNLVQENLISAAVNGDYYTLQIKGKVMLTGEDATLASGNIANGDTIYAIHHQVGGSRD
jgi:uncharacterized ubiquitin-like protein YukD